jgi:hypothetical protein
MSTFPEIRELRNRVILEASVIRKAECFTADPRALNSYLEQQLAGNGPGAVSEDAVTRITNEALRMRLVMSTPVRKSTTGS